MKEKKKEFLLDGCSAPIPEGKIESVGADHGAKNDPKLKPMVYGALDFRTPIGTPVRAVLSGVVVRIVKGKERSSGLGKSYGEPNQVVIMHNYEGEKVFTLYAHLGRIPEGLKEGQSVEKGQEIAKTGYSGDMKSEHLHFQAFLPDPETKIRGVLTNLNKEYKTTKLKK